MEIEKVIMNEENLDNLIIEMHSKKDFIEFVKVLIKDLRNNPDKWANISLEDFLDGIASCLEASTEVQKRNGVSEKLIEDTNWRDIAHILLAGRMYE